MFEAAIMPAAVGQGDPFRPLDWNELVIRFAAARDLRALVSRPCAAGGSFKGQADIVLHAEGVGEPPVNLGALGGVKALAAIMSATVDDRAKGAQGTQ